MKKFVLFIFVLTFFNIFSAEIEDYKLFLKGQTEYESQNYTESIKIFNNLEKTFPESNLFKATFAHYYIGKAYYSSSNYQKALEYLNKTTYHKNEVTYLLGNCYLNLKNNDEAKKHFIKLYSRNFRDSSSKYEKLALINLSAFDKKYNIIYESKFNNNFKNISELNYEDLEKIGDYFFSVGKYDSAITFFNKSYSLKKEQYLKVKILRSNFRRKYYSIAIKTGLEEVKTNIHKSEINFIIANSYRRKGELDNSIKYFKKVNFNKLNQEKNFLIGKLYYIKKEYSKAIEYLSLSNYTSALEYKTKCYKQLNKMLEFKKSMVEYIKKNPYSELAASYRYQLYKEENNKGYLKWIVKYNYNSYYAELAIKIIGQNIELPEYNLISKKSKYKDLIEKIDELGMLGIYEGQRIEIRNTTFPKEDKLFSIYLKTASLEKAKLYNLAIKNSFRAPYSFSKYSNLITSLYPNYYSEYVEKYSELYNVDKYLVYSIIKQESLFNSEDISKAAAYGLMQLIIPTAQSFSKNIKYNTLLDPETNIKIGTQYIQKLLKDNNNNLELAIASYNAGPSNAKKWLNKNGELEIEKIAFPETKNYVKKVLNNYYKYQRYYQ